MNDFIGFTNGVDFGGWLSQCSEYTTEHYQTFISENDFKEVSEWGLDHVRLPVDYQVFQNDDGSFIEQNFTFIQNAIDWAKKYNLNLILDLHKTMGFSFDVNYTNDGFFDNETLQSYFYKLWDEFAKRFSKYKEMLAFELLNEVTSKDLSDKWNKIIEKTIEVIRNTDKDIKILVGGYWNNSIDALQDLQPPTDKNIVYNFHCYEPMLFTHQAANWINNMPSDFVYSYPCNFEDYNKKAVDMHFEDFKISANNGNTETDASYFINRFEQGLKVCKERGVPLYCGEYGVIDNADANYTVKWYKDITEAFNKCNIGRAFWTYKSMSFGIQDEHMKNVKSEILKILTKQ